MEIRTELLSNFVEECGSIPEECEQWGLKCEECNTKVVLEYHDQIKRRA